MKKLKKGFTLVELVIVIAVIAVLAAVLIPTFSGIIQRAKVSNDISAVTGMNEALVGAGYTSTYKNKKDDFEVLFSTLKNNNYDFSTLNTSASGYHYVWESTEKQMLLYDDNFKFVATTSVTTEKANWEYWLPVKNSNEVIKVEGKTLNYVLTADYTGNIDITTASSFATAGKTLNGNVSIVTASQAAIDVKADINGTLTLNGENLTVNQYQTVKKINVVKVDTHSLNVYGNVSEELALTAGHVNIKANSTVATLDVKATTGVKVDNSGYVQNVTSSTATGGVQVNLSTIVTNDNGYIQAVDDTKVTGVSETESGYTLSIGTLEQLEAFRDAVNTGATYKGAVVQLTADITLSDGWTPIGAMARASSVQGFQGTFDGANKTISNLNNVGYTPDDNILFQNASTQTNKKEYLFGLFGQTSNVTIKNLTLANVNINIPNGTSIYGDKIGALIGFNYGTLNIDNCVIGTNSKVSGYDAIAGFVGGAYGAATKTISNSTNNAEITANEKGAGFIGYVSDTTTLVFSNCVNNGAILVGSSTANMAGTVARGAHAAGFAIINGKNVTVSFTSTCVNNGNISVTYNAVNTYGISASGFATENDAVALTTAKVGLNGATNSGSVKLNSEEQTTTATTFDFHKAITQ